MSLHIGIIIDGQREWGRLNKTEHSDGFFPALQKLLDWMYSTDDSIGSVTIFNVDQSNILTKEYAQENPTVLPKLQKTFLENQEKLMDLGWDIRILGYLDTIDEMYKNMIIDLESRNRPENKKRFQWCLNYSGRNEIVRAVKTLNKRGMVVNEENIEKCLDSDLQLDLIIRTGDSHKMVDFLSWQGANSIYYYSTKLWPDFEASDIQSAIKFYKEEIERTKKKK